MFAADGRETWREMKTNKHKADKTKSGFELIIWSAYLM